MAVSVFNLFSIGIGPSSSHTVGPMRAAKKFVNELDNLGLLSQTTRVVVELFGSLALTGRGHSTDLAILLGLQGETPEGVDPDQIPTIIQLIRAQHQLNLLGKQHIDFNEDSDLLFLGDKQLPLHPNAMRFHAYDGQGKQLLERVIYSVGGGFILEHSEMEMNVPENHHSLPYPFENAQMLLAQCERHNMTIAQLMMENEKTWRSESEIKKGLLNIWRVMKECTQRGLEQEGILPGGLHVKRRAPGIYKYLLAESRKKSAERDHAEFMDWVSAWALAVNEENAAGGRVVTAPTNGASGVIPSILHYYEKFIHGASEEGIVTFLLTAAAMGILFKKCASISAAEMGCMGEVGVASAMAAAGLTAVLGGTNAQIENAAEISMEHHLGLTCDPVKGLVQIPCIERNTMGANKAINAARLAYIHGKGEHKVSLDQVIATMRQTGHDMQSIYKETSQGGLAVNVPEC